MEEQRVAVAEEGDDEWSADTPLMRAGKLAELVQQTARGTVPPPFAAQKIAIEVDDEVTEIVAPLPVPPQARARVRVHHARWIAAAIALVAAGAAVPVIGDSLAAGHRAEAIARVRSDADQLALALDTAATAAKAHVRNLAATPMLRAGIETDAPTIQDLVDHEGLFAANAGAIIEVFQLRDGAAVSMVRRPAGAPALSPVLDDRTHLASDGRTVAVIAAAPIAKQSTGIGGVLAVGIPCDLSAIVRSLGDHATTAQLTGLDRPLVFVASSARGEAVTLPLAGSPGLALAAILPVAPVSSVPEVARATLWGAAALLLALYGLVLRRRDQPAR